MQFTGDEALTESEQTVPGETKLFPWFGNDGTKPLRNCSGIHGGLEGSEHEMQGSDVVLGFFGDVVFQTSQSTLVQDSSHTCEGQKLLFSVRFSRILHRSIICNSFSNLEVKFMETEQF